MLPRTCEFMLRNLSLVLKFAAVRGPQGMYPLDTLAWLLMVRVWLPETTRYFLTRLLFEEADDLGKG